MTTSSVLYLRLYLVYFSKHLTTLYFAQRQRGTGLQMLVACVMFYWLMSINHGNARTSITMYLDQTRKLMSISEIIALSRHLTT